MDKAAIYCRLSKEDEDKIKEGDESASIQNQKMMLVDFSLEKGIAVHDIYVDDDFKGFDYNRPEFNRMIMDAKTKKFNVIICKTQSRFTRDMEMVEKYIHGMFPLLGIRFIGVVDQVDTNVKGNKKARQINGLINEWYCEDLSENIRSVFKSKMEKGQFLGSFACYGYKKDPEDNHHLVVDEDAAAVVRKIYTWSVQGFGAQQICNRLYEEGIPTPTAYKKIQGLKFHHPNHHKFGMEYGLWGTTTIKKILSNSTYIGDMVQGKEKKVSYKSNKIISVPKNEWIIVPNCHEAIIDRETFNLVQKVMKTRKHYCKNKYTDGKKETFLLSGKCYCKDCGSRMTKVNGRNNSYLYCKLFYNTRNEHCSRHSIILEDLEKSVEKKIKAMIDNYLTVGENTDYLKDMIVENNDLSIKIKQNFKELSQHEDKINEINKAISMLYVDKANGIISNKAYIDLEHSLQEEIETNNRRVGVLKSERDVLNLNKDSISKLDTIIQKYSMFIELSHELINEFIDFIEVGEKDNDDFQEVIIHWRF